MQVWIKKYFAAITNSPKLSFRFRRLILLVKTKKCLLWTKTAAQSAENHGHEWGMSWYSRWGIYTSVPTWTHSQNSLAAAEVWNLKISSHWTCLKWSKRLPHSQNSLVAAEIQFKDISPWNISQIITKTVPISTRIVISYTVKVSLMESQWILRE